MNEPRPSAAAAATGLENGRGKRVENGREIGTVTWSHAQDNEIKRQTQM